MIRAILQSLVLGVSATAAGGVFAAPTCAASSGPTVTPVLELYTSEGCSSCPPADRWLSGLVPQAAEPGAAVIQAFHVGYWDYIGWVDRFANPAHTARQRQIASWNNQVQIYTPQAVLNGRDWRAWNTSGKRILRSTEAARASIKLLQLEADRFEALVAVGEHAPAQWSAYWTVTENSHSSRVQAGENAGELLQHDFVVRQFTPAGDFRGGESQRLLLRSIPPAPGHSRRINLVVFDSRTGKTLQAVAANC